MTDWVNYIKPEFLKRKVGEFKLSDVTDDESTFEGITKMERETLSKYADKNGDLFIKTYFKKSSGIINIANDRMPGMMKLFGYAMETMSPGTKFIASEKMDISKDEHGTKEYRCYVVCGKVNSLSRYVDNNIVNIPDCVYSFSKKFVLAHSDIF